MTVIVLLVIAAVGVASLLYKWGARLDVDAARAPLSLSYSLAAPASPSQPWTDVAEDEPQPWTHATEDDSQSWTHVTEDDPQSWTHVTEDDPQPWTRESENDMLRWAAPAAPRPSAPRPELLDYLMPVRPRDDDDDADDTAETVRFVRPTEFAVQLLPGRLEVLEGATPHHEIRFLRAPGEPTHVILGREIKVTPHYVGLGSPMVSRRHARFDFADNRWIVKNLSRTNPLIINDDELSDTDAARPLADGDRLEIGDVILRFHAQ
jgi:hypothetical protein